MAQATARNLLVLFFTAAMSSQGWSNITTQPTTGGLNGLGILGIKRNVMGGTEQRKLPSWGSG